MTVRVYLVYPFVAVHEQGIQVLSIQGGLLGQERGVSQGQWPLWSLESSDCGFDVPGRDKWQDGRETHGDTFVKFLLQIDGDCIELLLQFHEVFPIVFRIVDAAG